MAVQKSKKSKAKTNSRFANFKVKAPTLVECPQCHDYKQSHRVCKKCGYYDGQLIVEEKAKKAE